MSDTDKTRLMERLTLSLATLVYGPNVLDCGLVCFPAWLRASPGSPFPF